MKLWHLLSSEIGAAFLCPSTLVGVEDVRDASTFAADVRVGEVSAGFVSMLDGNVLDLWFKSPQPTLMLLKT